jgi:hypothetical protein
MDTQKAQADLAKLHAEIMWVFEEVQKANRQHLWLTPLVTASALLAIGSGFAAVCVQFAKLLVHSSH